MAEETDQNQQIQVAPRREPMPFDPKDTSQMYRYAEFLARSKLVPKALRGDPYAILHVMLYGRELGIPPALAPASLHIIEGKIGMDATEMLKRVQGSEHCEFFVCVEQTNEGEQSSATWETRRRGWPEGMTAKVTWNIDRAKEMGLWDKGRNPSENNWQKQPLTMCKRRAQTELIRDVYPDVITAYSYDELRDISQSEPIDVEPVEVPDGKAGKARSVKDRIRRKAAGEDDMPGGPMPDFSAETALANEMIDRQLADESGNDCERCSEYRSWAGQPDYAICGLCSRKVAVVSQQLWHRDLEVQELQDMLVDADDETLAAMRDKIMALEEAPPMTDAEKAAIQAEEAESQQSLEVD